MEPFFINSMKYNSDFFIIIVIQGISALLIFNERESYLYLITFNPMKNKENIFSYIYKTFAKVL